LELTPNVASSIETNGQIALGYLRLGQEEKALAHAERVLSLSEKISPTVYSMDIGFSGVADVYFELWEKAIQSKRTDSDYLRQCAEKAVKLLRAFEKVFPIGQPVTPVYQGWYEWLTGKPDAAIKTLTKGLEAAQKFQMRYEEGLIRLKLAMYAQGNLEARKTNLGRAIELFEQMGAVNELRLAQEEARRAGI
jgi:tetratricopeptide (TPR) repeat protein